MRFIIVYRLHCMLYTLHFTVHSTQNTQHSSQSCLMSYSQCSKLNAQDSRWCFHACPFCDFSAVSSSKSCAVFFFFPLLPLVLFSSTIYKLQSRGMYTCHFIIYMYVCMHNIICCILYNIIYCICWMFGCLDIWMLYEKIEEGFWFIFIIAFWMFATKHWNGMASLSSPLPPSPTTKKRPKARTRTRIRVSLSLSSFYCLLFLYKNTTAHTHST